MGSHERLQSWTLRYVKCETVPWNVMSVRCHSPVPVLLGCYHCVCVDCLAAIGQCFWRGVAGQQEGREVAERVGQADQDHECCRLQEQGAAACAGGPRTQGGLLVPRHTCQAPLPKGICRHLHTCRSPELRTSSTLHIIFCEPLLLITVFGMDFFHLLVDCAYRYF